jgi:hypothetical protein
VIPHAQQILMHADASQHVTLLTAGQLELNNYVNTEAKYTKFAYSSRFGFTIERGRYGLKHAACDSMLLLADGDNYFRGRRECDVVRVMKITSIRAGRRGTTSISKPGRSRSGNGICACTVLTVPASCKQWKGLCRDESRTPAP